MVYAASRSWSKDLESAAKWYARSKYQFGNILQETKDHVIPLSSLLVTSVHSWEIKELDS